MGRFELRERSFATKSAMQVSKRNPSQSEWGGPSSKAGDTIVMLTHDLLKANEEIELLRRALKKYGNRSAMSFAEPSELQQVIDRAFEN